MEKRASVIAGLFLLAGILISTTVRAAEKTEPFLVATDFATPDSATGGIQEAVDALPSGGGTVYLPAGTYTLQRPVLLKNGTKLAGAGKGTVLRKNPAFKVYLAEDAKAGQEYIVVRDASALRKGMAIAVADRKHEADTWTGMFLITRIEGPRVYLSYIRGGGPLRYDLSVRDDACLMNLFMLVLPARDCVVEDMELDGAADQQMLEEAKRYGFVSYGMLWCGIYPCGQMRISRCWVHDCGIGIHVNGGETEISHCRIYNNRGDGIHCGGGPLSTITANRLYGNLAGGITFCYGNTGLVISNNHIYENGTGIAALGINEPDNDVTADRLTIITENVVYHNRGCGIASGQGPEGPRDCVFANNIVRDNNLSMSRAIGVHQVPAGISLYSAKRCVISGNRCMNEQPLFARTLAKPAEAGQRTISVADSAYPAEGWVLIADGERDEIRRIVRRDGEDLRLDAPLAYAHKAGTGIRNLSSQSWGIFVGGPGSEGNVITGNICEGNAVGGILWEGTDCREGMNVGKTVRVDAGKTLEENVFPARRSVPLPNAGFERNAGWNPGPFGSFAKPGRSGRRCLKLGVPVGPGTSEAWSDLFRIEASTRYRLTAWVRTEARTDGHLTAPCLLLCSKGGMPVGNQTLPARYAAEQATLESGRWTRVFAEIQTGPVQTDVRIYCRLENARGDAWVDDVVLEELEKTPSPGLSSSGPALDVPRVSTPVVVDGKLNEIAWEKLAARIEAFFLASGDSPAYATTAYLLRDGEMLYVAFRCLDPDPSAVKRDAVSESGVFADDAVAILIQPDIYSSFHYQLAISAGGARFDQKFADGAKDTRTFQPRWRAAAAVTGDGWTAEAAIPLSLIFPAVHPARAVFGANIGRSTRDRERSSWVPSDNWHNVADYGRLRF